MVKKLAVFAAFAGCICLAANSQGATLNVSSMAELQSALTTAEFNGQDDTINVAAGYYTVSGPLSYVVAEQYSITVTGAGRGRTILDGGGVSQIMALDTSLADNDQGTSVKISGISFVNGNNAGGNGGGLEIQTNLADVIVQNCKFSNNESSPPDPGPGPWPERGPGGGGGLYVAVGVTDMSGLPDSGGDVFVKNNLFIGNSSSNGAGTYIFAIARFYPKTEFANNILAGNTASINGGGVWLGSDYLFFLNNTNVVNTASADGGGAYLDTSHTTDIFNNIIWNNASAGAGEDIYIYNPGYAEHLNLINNTYSSRFLYQSDTISESENSNEDPSLDANYSLRDGSGCIDSGENSAPNLPGTDFDGNQRIHNGTVDRGAKEFGSTITPDSASDPGDSSAGGGGGGCFIDAILGAL